MAYFILTRSQETENSRMDLKWMLTSMKYNDEY